MIGGLPQCGRRDEGSRESKVVSVREASLARGASVDEGADMMRQFFALLFLQEVPGAFDHYLGLVFCRWDQFAEEAIASARYPTSARLLAG